MSANQYMFITKEPLNRSEIEHMKTLFKNKNFKLGEDELFENVKFVLNELSNYQTLTHEAYSVDNIDGVKINEIKNEYLIEINQDFEMGAKHFADVTKAYKNVEVAKMDLRHKLTAYDNTNPKSIIENSMIEFEALDSFSDELFDEERSIEDSFIEFLSEHCIEDNE